MGNMFDFLKTISYWILSRFRNIIDAVTAIGSMPTPRSKKERRAYEYELGEHKRLLIVSVLQLLGVVVALILLFLASSALASPILWIFFSLFNVEDMFVRGIFRSMVFVFVAMTGLGAVLSVFDWVTGRRIVVQPPSEQTYQFLLEILFEVIGKIASPLRLVPPAHTSDLLPGGEKYYNDGVTPIYRYSVMRKDSAEPDVDKIFRVVNDRLHKHLAIERLGVLGGYNSEGILLGAVILVDAKITADYCILELAVTDESSVNIQRRRQNKRRQARHDVANTADNEF